MIMNISSNCYETFAQPITYKLISLKVIHIIGINDLTANVYIITMNANFLSYLILVECFQIVYLICNLDSSS